ncbi:MAG TPA: NEW3 domain-containing protein [Pyrinomonadaceae bacterium]|nr:NEW3 domain-containing protein [Pyrinomonadaceae bacterium]
MKKSNSFPNKTRLRSIIWSTAFVLLSLAVATATPITSAKPGRAIRLEGEIEVVYEDSHDRGRLLYFLHAGGKRLELRFAKTPQQRLRTGMHVAVSGVQVGETLELNSGDGINIGSGEAAVSGNSFGQHRVLVVMVNFQDKQTQPFTREQAQAVMFGTTNDFYREASYGQTWLTGDVYGWYTIPVNASTCDTTAIANYAQQAAAAAGANVAGYDHMVYAFPQNACTWQGRGSVGGSPSHAWVNEWFELGIVGHELGHNFGLYHSKSMDCGAVSIGSNCTTSEYGDMFDLMGGANSAHFNLFQKENLGWTNNGANPPITNVSTSGTYWLDSFEYGTMTPKGLKILKSTDPVTGMKTWYYVEHRAAYGFDSFLSGNGNILNGVIVRTGSESNGQNTYLLDMTPATASWYDPALTVGQSFTDSDAGVTITTLSADTTGALVDVTFASQPCVRANPTLTVDPSQDQWLPSGGTATFNVVLRNNDGNGCQPGSFNFQPAIPTGWTASSLPATVLNPGATAATTFQITSPAGTVDGFYNINVSVANGSYSTSAVATYALVSTLSVTNNASQKTYTRNQTAAVSATVKAAGLPLSGTAVTFTMTKSNGTTVSGTSTTGANGIAVFSYSFNRKKDPAGTYQVRAQANKNGVSGSSTVSFTVK